MNCPPLKESDRDDDADVFEELEDSSSKARDIVLQQDTLRILDHAAHLLRVAARDHDCTHVITSDNVSVLISSSELLNLAKKYRKFCQEQGEVSQSFQLLIIVY